MKTVTILFAEKNSKYMFEPAFGGKSAFEKALEWAGNNKSEGIFVFTGSENREKAEKLLGNAGKVVAFPEWNTAMLLGEMARVTSEAGADSAVFSFADCPFLNRPLTEEILGTHSEFLAEYTFADGYPYGFSPEVIDGGTLRILKQLSETSQKEASEKPVTRTCIFDFMKTDINAFEIETVLADEDYRLLRYSFDAGKKENFLQCKALYESLSETEKEKISETDVETLCKRASENKDILKTVPGFYNIQLSPLSDSKPDYIPEDSPLNCGPDMDTEKLFSLIDQIAELSENAVVSLSYFGDPVKHPDFVKICGKILSYTGLSVFIETDFMGEEIAGELKAVTDKALPRTNGFEKIMIAVCLDAASAGKYAEIRKRPESDFEKALGNVALLSDLFPGSCYPQFVRLNENESELETFYRYWNEKSNPSKGNLIIQKYNSFCGTLPERKPADLSPVERNVCWHLRRDVNILSNGDVTFCHSVYGKKAGNVFETPLSEIWKDDEELKNHISKKYCEKCGKCDEYYTFNF